MENDAINDHSIRQDYIFIDYCKEGIFRYLEQERHLSSEQNLIMKILDNDVFFSQHKMDPISVLKQFSCDFPRSTVKIGNAGDVASSDDALFAYIENHPFLKVNKNNVLLCCTQVIIIFALHLIFRTWGSVLVAERNPSSPIVVQISPTKIILSKYLRAAQ